MRKLFYALCFLLWIENLGWAQMQRLPSAIARGLMKSSAVSAVENGGKSLGAAAALSAPKSYLKTLERNNFYDLDLMLRDYFALNPQSASPQLIKENEQLQELLVKKWLERDFYAFSHQKQLLENVLVEVIQGKIDYLNYIPHDARLIMLGEIHEQDWMAGSAENAVLQFKQAYPDKNIYYVSEFIDAVPEQGIYLLSKEKEVEALVNKRPYYRPMTKRMIAAGVRVVGLENPEISTELARIGYTQNFPNTQLAWKTISPSGMRERNMYWEKIIRRIYAQDPDAVVFVHAGFGHTNYNQPKALSILLKDLQPFVVEYAAPGVGDFNTLLERNIPLPPETLAKGKQLQQCNVHRPVFFIRYMKNKRGALVAGCDLHIKKALPR